MKTDREMILSLAGDMTPREIANATGFDYAWVCKVIGVKPEFARYPNRKNKVGGPNWKERDRVQK